MRPLYRLTFIIPMLCLPFVDPVLGQEPEDNQGHMHSAKAFYDQGNLDAADRELDAALRVEKKTPLAHYWKGMIALQRDDLRKAEKAFRKARGQNRRLTEPYLGLGLVYLRMKNRKMDAIQVLREAIKRDPNSVEAYYQLAIVYKNLSFGDIAPFGFFKPMYVGKGIDALKRTLELSPDHPQANHDLGLTYELGLNNVEKALPYYVKQLESNPRHEESLDRLGRGYIKTGKYTEGVTTLNRLTRTFPAIEEKIGPTLAMLEATLHLNNGQFDKAEETFEAYIHTLPFEEQTMYRNVTYVLTEEENKRFEALTPVQQEEYTRTFWKSRDSDLTTPANERLAEHYRRALFSRTNFGENTFPWDRRGDMYIRYGEPDDRQQFTLSVGQLQQANQGSRRSGSVPTIQDMGDAIREGAQSSAIERHAYAPTGDAGIDAIREMNFQQRYQVAVEASTVGLSAYRVESWVYVAVGIELFFVDQLNNGIFDYPLMTRSRDVRQVARQSQFHPARLAAEMIKNTPEIYEHDFGGDPLEYYYDIVTYQGEGSTSDIEISFAVPAYQLGAQTDGQGEITSLNARATMMDEGWEELFSSEMQFGPFARPTVLRTAKNNTAIATFQIPMSIFPGEAELAVSVRDAVTRKIGIYRQPLSIPSYTARTLLMSDIKLATSITPTIRKRGAFIRNGYEIVPNPTRIFAGNQLVYIYYELYNLTLAEDGRSRFQTDIRVSFQEKQTNAIWRVLSEFGKLIGGSETDNALFYSIEDASDATFVARFTGIDITGSEPGRYTIEITVTDLLKDQVVVKDTHLLVAEEVARRSSPVVRRIGRDADETEETMAWEQDDSGKNEIRQRPTPSISLPENPLEGTTRANPSWEDLLRVLNTPEYALATDDSTREVVEDTTVTSFISGLKNNINQKRTGSDMTKDMVLIPAGMFLMGSDSTSSDEGPMQSIYVNAFYIDRYEVTNEAYKSFIEASGHPEPNHWTDRTFPSGEARYPLVGISWYDAQTFTQWAGKRLPTEVEWEKAARGDDGRIYPWGDDFVPGWVNTKGDGDAYTTTAPVGSFSKGVSPYGVFDMAGNVWEWSVDWFDRYPGNTAENPTYGQQYRVIRGGSWINYDGNIKTFNRGKFYPSDTSLLLGFRCATDADRDQQTDSTIRGYGYLRVATPGAWADIYIDGERLGQTPQADPLRIRPGSHVLKLVNPYFEAYEKTIDINPDSMQKERVVLERKSED
ncbi:MAG: SUMF1/EgtB/PvdO family nonheme iron enzyme [Candidatus Latescibacteria bacterium]|nr:SUMF1/EgtB/PvdO family nonheme iron enzyme [Candidatus Latescibacterota bacterium]